MNWIFVTKFHKPFEVSEFKRFLESRNIEFKFTEDQTDYSLWVPSEEEKQKVILLMDNMIARSSRNSPLFSKEGVVEFGKRIIEVPVTSLIIIAAVVLYVLESLGYQGAMWELIFAPFGWMYETNQWWRLFTPALLHGGFIHLLFNVLWIWELGVKLERYLGKSSYTLVVVISGVFSNTAQYVASGHINFRGLSGIIYAFIGFLWLYGKFTKEKSLYLPDGIYIFMFVWLGLGMLGIIDQLLPGNISIANAAHFGGLIIGLIFALACIKVKQSPVSSVGGDKGDDK